MKIDEDLARFSPKKWIEGFDDGIDWIEWLLNIFVLFEFYYQYKWIVYQYSGL